MTSEKPRTSRANFEETGRKIERELQDAGRKVELETERMITYLNDEVVPAVRSKSTRALRAAAERLAQLADSMEADTRASEKKRSGQS